MLAGNSMSREGDSTPFPEVLAGDLDCVVGSPRKAFAAKVIVMGDCGTSWCRVVEVDESELSVTPCDVNL